jgi:hypothetical protein
MLDNSEKKFMDLITISRRSLAVGIVLLFTVQFGSAQVAPLNTDVDKRVEWILGKMTLDEKIEIIGGINDFYTRSIPRLGIPSLRMSDGPMGVHDYGLTTAYPEALHWQLPGMSISRSVSARLWVRTPERAECISFSAPV